jgi:hypothetical protein
VGYVVITLSDYLPEFVAEWFGDGPRSLGTPEQRLIYDSLELLPLFDQDQKPVWLSVNPYDSSGKIAYIDRLFFDFDNKDKLRLAWEDCYKFACNLWRFYRIKPFLVYSGKKGYHAYLFLRTPAGHELEDNHKKELYRELQSLLLGSEKYPTFDPAVYGDHKRIARVPFTKHQDTKNLVQPVDLNQFEALPLPGFTQGLRHYGVSLNIVSHAANNYNENIVTRLTTRKSSKHRRGTLRPCMEELLSAKSIHDPEHKLKVCLVAELSAEGRTRDQIIDVFRGMDGFSESKTSEQVDHALRSGYSPFKCVTIQKLGGCLENSCRIYKKRGGLGT